MKHGWLCMFLVGVSTSLAGCGEEYRLVLLTGAYPFVGSSNPGVLGFDGDGGRMEPSCPSPPPCRTRDGCASELAAAEDVTVFLLCMTSGDSSPVHSNVFRAQPQGAYHRPSLRRSTSASPRALFSLPQPGGPREWLWVHRGDGRCGAP